jgi:hypothetical protein
MQEIIIIDVLICANGILKPLHPGEREQEEAVRSRETTKQQGACSSRVQAT